MLQGSELRVVVGFVAVALGGVGVKCLQFADTFEYLAGDLERAILRLQKRHGVADVRGDRTLAASRGGQLHRDGQAACVVGRRNNFRAAREPVQALLQHSVGGGEVVRCDGRSKVCINDN
jgi:hypothetical protein